MRTPDKDENKIDFGLKINVKPRGIGINEFTNKIYLTHDFSNSITVIDGSTNDISKSITVMENPELIAFDEITNIGYIGGPESNEVAIIDGYTDQLMQVFKYR